MLLKKLEVTLATREYDSSSVKQIKGVIQKDIGQRYQSEDISTLLKVAMLLEPRFKEMPFLNRAEKQQVKEIVKFEFQRFIEWTVELHVEDAPTLPESEPSYHQLKRSWNYFLKISWVVAAEKVKQMHQLRELLMQKHTGTL